MTERYPTLDITSQELNVQRQYQSEIRKRAGWFNLYRAQAVNLIQEKALGRSSPPSGDETFDPWLPAIPGLDDKPFYDEKLPWFDELIDSYSQLRTEAKILYKTRGEKFPEHRADIYNTNKWRAIDFVDQGQLQSHNLAYCPATERVIKKLPIWFYCGYSVLAPGAEIKAHTGYTNAALTCHFGLNSCKGCYINVGGETREYEDGKILVFSDSFRHSVINNSDDWRITLMFFFPHPKLAKSSKNIYYGILKNILGASESSKVRLD